MNISTPLMFVLFLLGSIGSFHLFDKIASKSIKDRMADLIDGHTDHHKEKDIPGYIRYFIDNTVGYWFRGDHINLKNSYNSLLLSIISLSIVVPLICVLNNTSLRDLLTISGPILSYFNIFCLIILFACCLSVDIISFLQTAMFMRIASRIPSMRDMLFMSFFDIIVTVNLFVFVFPLFSSIIIAAIDLNGRDFELEFATGLEIERPSLNLKEKPSALEAKFDKLAGDETFKHLSIDLKSEIIHPDSDKNSYGGVAYLRSVTKGIDQPEVLRLALTELRLQSSKREDDIEAEIKSLAEKLPSMIDGEPIDPKELRSLAESHKRTYFTTRVHMGSAYSSLNPLQFYFTLYQNSHTVQDEFLSLIKFHVVRNDINAFFMRIPTVLLEDPLPRTAPFFEVCDKEVSFKSDIEQNRECEKRAVVFFGNTFKELYRNSYFFSPSIRSIPISVFALSSLFMAFGFYTFLFLFIASSLMGGIFRYIAFGKNIIDYKSWPFSAAAIYLCVVLALPALLFGFLVHYLLIA